MAERYTVLRGDRAAGIVVAGDTVYRCSQHDYGIARDDSNATGIEHISVTFNDQGQYPFFTIPVEDLKEA